MRTDVASYSALGKRKNNEDAVSAAACKAGLLAIVADGLGGHANGEYASQAAVNIINRSLVNLDISEDDIEDAVYDANDEVLKIQEQHPGAMTTITVLWLGDSSAVAAHVGDSRIYQFRDGKIIYQSVDHSVSQLAVMAGDIRPEEIRNHKDRNKLTRALGAEAEPKVAVKLLRVMPGDRFLLCSDGFWEMVTEEQMLLFASRCSDAESWLKEMRAIAEPRSKDNNTAVAVIVEKED